MPENTLTIERANGQLRETLQNSLSALPSELGHEIQYQETSMSCAKPGTDSPSGLVRATLDYRITGADETKIPEYFVVMRHWWTSHNYRVLRDQPHNRYLWVEHQPDGFRLALEANDFGELYIGATSPCVWPDGTPEPGEG